jgi:hypothetical protein
MNSLLAQRLKAAGQKLSKMTGLAELSSQGNLSSFAGVFRVSPLNEKEEEKLLQLLNTYKSQHQEIEDDLRLLSDITSEVKAINNQAAILHGERIKKAQDILTKYRDGAFSAWLISIYGNRQTPYNFLQYYELHVALPTALLSKLDEMPRQAVYTLASRNAPLAQKEEIIKNYRGEPKGEILSKIRKSFPLAENDQRAEDIAEQVASTIKRALLLAQDSRFRPSAKQKESLKRLCSSLSNLISQLQNSSAR